VGSSASPVRQKTPEEIPAASNARRLSIEVASTTKAV
jgi:hypothetical protein